MRYSMSTPSQTKMETRYLHIKRILHALCPTKSDKQELLRFISEVDQAAVEVGDFLERLRPNEI